ncbi:MAG: hypothetical protein AAFR61_31325 [Bacteroidota bacterium]
MQSSEKEIREIKRYLKPLIEGLHHEYRHRLIVTALIESAFDLMMAEHSDPNANLAFLPVYVQGVAMKRLEGLSYDVPKN